MDTFYSKSHISFLIFLFIAVVGVFSFEGLINEKSLFLDVSAQELPDSMTSMTNTSNISALMSDDSTIEQNKSKTLMASGHFANNQMKDGIVTWIQGGIWDLKINDPANKNMGNTNASATFDANFTMIKPDGSLSHNHAINKFTSNSL